MNDEILQWFLPYMSSAVTRAENDPTGMHGVRSLKTDNPNLVLNNSIVNNYRRWVGGQTPAPWISEKPAKFVDFMQKRWAPIGASNDKKNLNANWAGNVRKILQQLMSKDDYEKAKQLNLVYYGGDDASYT